MYSIWLHWLTGSPCWFKSQSDVLWGCHTASNPAQPLWSTIHSGIVCSQTICGAAGRSLNCPLANHFCHFKCKDGKKARDMLAWLNASLNVKSQRCCGWRLCLLCTVQFGTQPAALIWCTGKEPSLYMSWITLSWYVSHAEIKFKTESLWPPLSDMNADSASLTPVIQWNSALIMLQHCKQVPRPGWVITLCDVFVSLHKK